MAPNHINIKNPRDPCGSRGAPLCAAGRRHGVSAAEAVLRERVRARKHGGEYHRVN